MSGADRIRRWRRNQREGLIVLPVPLPEHAFAERAIALGLLTLAEALQRENLKGWSTPGWRTRANRSSL